MASDFDKFLKKYGKDDQISGTDIKDATKAGYSFAELDKFTKKANKQGLKSGNSTLIQLDKLADQVDQVAQVAQVKHPLILPLEQRTLISI